MGKSNRSWARPRTMDHRPQTTDHRHGLCDGHENKPWVCSLPCVRSKTTNYGDEHEPLVWAQNMDTIVKGTNKFQISTLPSDNPESKERFRIVLLGVARTYSELSELSDSEELFRFVNLKYLPRFCLFKSLQLSFYTCSFSFVVYVPNNFFPQLFPPTFS
jgi:hypothetical protein